MTSAQVASQTDVRAHTSGSCTVHERLIGQEIADHRRDLGDVSVIADPGCSLDMLAEADYVGSTKRIAMSPPRASGVGGLLPGSREDR